MREKAIKKTEKILDYKFYQFGQNNSGGSFETDSNLCHRLFIEASSEEEAIIKAESLGCYFNGVDLGSDCPCCGDRWNSPTELIFPYQFGSFSISDAEKIAEKYRGEKVPTKFNMYRLKSKEDRFDVIFNDIEEYSQYMADKYGWTSPDARIFYLNGIVKEIHRKL